VILAIDTTSEFGSMALVNDAGVVGELSMHSPDGFSHVLYEHLTNFLATHNVRLTDIDCFASAAGPGSFTGVRVGLAAVKGLAEATAKPATAVSNLQALAAFGTAPLRATLLDARRGDVFGAVYNAALEPVQPEVVMKFEAWQETLPAGAEIIKGPRALAGAIGQIAWQRLQRGEVTDPALLDANYVRRSDAELFWKE